ncbi:uncharacterized protein FA14DRAFT_54982 [Meira miltonrushii]|uniref:F-box domain-containing protein n=1 Tax=Meira miltonrushii TaxID=1280837 RepID=A0A316VJD7_9BASI|nr:uncharacterized protein FA14DRAFT_54982 [Meira miltonrushii]PWN36413.1 hypothetical protein FA14DRAFT_54982 [Meira miltonrushii]
MLTRSRSKQKQPVDFVNNLPPEILVNILSHFTVLELAKVQRTCKAWYKVAQNTPSLWRKSGPFFFRVPFYSGTYFQGVKALSKLSAGNLDEIRATFSDEAVAIAGMKAFLENIPALNPTSLYIGGLGRSCLDLFLLIGRCKSLRVLNLYFELDPSEANNYTFKNHPMTGGNLESLTLNEISLSMWQKNEACMSVSSSIKRLSLDLTDDLDGVVHLDMVHTFDFLYHCRQSIEYLHFSFVDCSLFFNDFLDERTGLHKELVFPNLTKLLFKIDFVVDDDDDNPLPDDREEPFHQFNCPQVEELRLPHEYFLKLFDSAESIKTVELDWKVDNLADAFQRFPNIEKLKATLSSQEILPILIDQVPSQLKHLDLSLSAGMPDDELLCFIQLVRKYGAKQEGRNFTLLQEGATEFCFISIVIEDHRVCFFDDKARYTRLSMCKESFVEIFTSLRREFSGYY